MRSRGRSSSLKRFPRTHRTTWLRFSARALPSRPGGRAIDTVIDNDLILKSASYGLGAWFWPDGEPASIGVLGAARYVVSHHLDRAPLNRDVEAAQSDLSELLARCETLEPTEAEVDLATEIELFGQENGLALDSGESQLAAIVVIRDIALLETGDKRAIAALEAARGHICALGVLSGRVRCLEQIARRLAGVEESYPALADNVCAEAKVDKTLSICFGCFGDSPADRTTALEALGQYVEDLRRSAGSVLVDDPQ